MVGPRPCFDIYALTRHRTRDVIDQFLDAYVDVAASEDREDEELMMVPADYAGPLSELGECEWRPAETLTSVVAFIVAEPHRAFVVYLTARDRSLDRAMLACTRDGTLVFGLSVPVWEPPTKGHGLNRARTLLTELGQLVDAEMTAIAVEQPPPLDRVEFAAWARDACVP